MIPFPALPALFTDGIFVFHSITLPHYITECASLQFLLYSKNQKIMQKGNASKPPSRDHLFPEKAVSDDIFI